MCGIPPLGTPPSATTAGGATTPAPDAGKDTTTQQTSSGGGPAKDAVAGASGGGPVPGDLTAQLQHLLDQIQALIAQLGTPVDGGGGKGKGVDGGGGCDMPPVVVDPDHGSAPASSRRF